MNYIIFFVVGLLVIASCQDNEEIIHKKERALTLVEIRAVDMLVKHSNPQRTFHNIWQTKYFRHEINDDSTLALLDSLLLSITGEIKNTRQEYFTGLVAHYHNGVSDSLGFGYQGIHWRGKLYLYNANTKLVETVASFLPSVNKYTLLLGINPDNEEVKRQLREAINRSLIKGAE